MTVITSHPKELLKQEHGAVSLPARHTHAHGYQLHLFRWWAEDKLRANISHRPDVQPKVLILASAVVISLAATAYGASFFRPQSLSLSFAGESCIANPVLMPRSVATKPSASYTASYSDIISIAGYPIYSGSTCITPTATPQAGTRESLSLAPFNNPLLQKDIRVSSGALPTAKAVLTPGKSISAKAAVIFEMDGGNGVFSYAIVSNDKRSECDKQDDGLSCDLAPLGLAQAQTHKLTLQRSFNGKQAGAAAELTVTIIEPITVTNTSIGSGAIVYDKPAGMTLALSKEISAITGLRLEQISGSTRTAVPTSFTHDGTAINVAFTSALPRSASYELVIDDVKGTDGSFLRERYVLPFKTSGGPSVMGISIGSYKIPTNAAFSMTFDSALDASQNIGDFVSIEENGQKIGTTATMSGASVRVSANTALPRCTSFTVKVRAGLVSAYGVGDGAAWSYTSRTICQTIFSIGTSVNGRVISAYSFGSGSSKVVFVGGTHGDEKSSSYTLNSLVDYLEANPGAVPAHRSVIIIPILNPDGYAASRRTNANNVDLNRNFATSDWKQSVTMPDKSTNPNGGGTSALSEPESAALARYIAANKPRLILTYHAVAGVVIPNDSGDSVVLAQAYDRKSNLYYKSNASTGTIFEYDVTGSFEHWTHEVHAIPTLLVETWTMSSNEFGRNQPAMLEMIALP